MISVIVPCKNRIERLSECLESIECSIKYAYKKNNKIQVETIVVNDHSEQGFSKEIKKRFPNVKIIDSVGFGPGVARNYGILMSKGKYIFFTDSDCIVDEGWILEGYNSFMENNFIVIQGVPWLFQKRENEFLGSNEEKLYEIMFSSYVDGHSSTMTDSRNLLMNREITNIIGEKVFSEKIDKATAESRVFGKKCISNGINIFFDERIKVYHEDSKDMKGVCSQKYRHGNGRVLIWNEKPSYKHLKFRYYDNPIRYGISRDYILPAHTAFLLGYYQNLNDKDEYNKFKEFLNEVFASYDRDVEDYQEIVELLKNE